MALNIRLKLHITIATFNNLKGSVITQINTFCDNDFTEISCWCISHYYVKKIPLYDLIIYDMLRSCTYY